MTGASPPPVRAGLELEASILQIPRGYRALDRRRSRGVLTVAGPARLRGRGLGARLRPGGGRVLMLPRVPVSRKRKKKPGSSGRSSVRSRPSVSQPERAAAPAAWDDRELMRAFRGLAAYRDQADTQRATRAAAMATDLVADLARAGVDEPDVVVTDALCERLGALLADDERSPVDMQVEPHRMAEATLAAAEASVGAA